MYTEFDRQKPVAQAATPPASWYNDPTFYASEKAKVFASTWQPVGRVHQVEKPGAFISGRFMEKPYVVVRDLDGELRAFYNVCRHHAAELVQGEGCLRKFSCPYHGWNYSLKGELTAAPRLQGIEDFNKSEFALYPLRVEAVGPFVWVGFDVAESAPTPKETFAAVWSQLADTGYEKLQFHSRRSYEINCNWKVYVDNYLDGGYHVGILHKQLTSQLQLNGYRTEVGANYSIQSCKGDNPRIGDRALYAWLYPGFMINRYGPVMDTNWVVPLSPDRCLTVFDFYFADVDGQAQQDFIRASLAISEQVQQEDVMISESVQRGLQSGAYSVGRYAPEVEHAMHAFHLRLAADLSKT